jgi:hypothetical protein
MFEKMEIDIVALALKKHPDMLQQVNTITISKREFTGVGFFTFFVDSCDDSDLQLSDVVGVLNEKINVGFTLFVNNGKISCLEGYTYDEPWPNEILSYKVFLSE